MIQLKVNGVEQSFVGEPEMPLLWYLRDVLGLTGSKFGCGVGLCGACTVHVNGQATRSCVTAMRDAAGKEVTTIEGLDRNGLHSVQKAPHITERLNFQLRFEFFNLFNHANLQSIQGDLSAGNFGRVTSQTLPRWWQIGGKLIF
jgi:2Fe-2S iron-sulfur cluster binding domain